MLTVDNRLAYVATACYNIIKLKLIIFKMRIWHKDLIPKLCRQHLLAVWRESLGAYKIITEGKQGYRNHPATQEFINSPADLYKRLKVIREEMLRRGYNPKELPPRPDKQGKVKEWQSLAEQIEVIKNKNCKCII